GLLRRCGETCGRLTGHGQETVPQPVPAASTAGLPFLWTGRPAVGSRGTVRRPCPNPAGETVSQPRARRASEANVIPYAVTSSAGSARLLDVLLALAVVVALGRALGVLFVRIGQPPVIGEVVAGILLGPSLLGRVAPNVAGYILPPHSAPYLGVIAQLGVVLYLFLVGLELN